VRTSRAADTQGIELIYIHLCSSNNPTGGSLTRATIERVVRDAPVVIIDFSRTARPGSPKYRRRDEIDRQRLARKTLPCFVASFTIAASAIRMRISPKVITFERTR